MPTFDSATQSELNAATANKTSFSTALKNALGANRRLVFKRDANSAATDVWSSGTEFHNVGSTGEMTITGGDIISFGTTSNVTVRQAADLSTGKSVMRIQGSNGRWAQYTFGLDGSGMEFTFPTNFTTTTNVAMASSAKLPAPKLLPTGVGPAAPVSDANRPGSIALYNWSNPAAPTLVGSLSFNTRDDDFCFEDSELALSNGDVAIYKSDASIVHGNFEFGGILMVSHASNTEAGNVPLYQVLIACKYVGPGWTTYPKRDTYVKNTHSVFPTPFKIVLKDSAATPATLYTFQMQDGLPINSPSLSQTQTDSAPLRPLFTCAMMLPWQNTRPRLADKALKYYPGMHVDSLRPSNAHSYLTGGGVEPLITGGYGGNSRNGLFNMWATPQWPKPAAPYNPTVVDPYVPMNLYNTTGEFQGQKYAPWVCGWDYEPGSYSMHNWYTGPGGPRFDRCAIPSVLAMWMTNPTGVRTQEAAPWRSMADGFLMGYFNHGNHFLSNVKSFTLAPNTEFLNHTWHVTGSYYGDGDPTGKKAIQINGNQQVDYDPPTVASFFDSNGRNVYNGWGRDWLHSYANTGWGALLLNSPMHAIGQKFDTIMQLMLNQAAGTPVNLLGRDGAFGTRQQAWMWLNLTIAWKLGSAHPLGFTRAEIEAYFITHLELIYTQVYKPAFVDNASGPYYEGIRNLGCPYVFHDLEYGYWRALNPGGKLYFYMAHVLQLMKQTGLWSVLHAKGGHVTAVLDMHIRNLDLYGFGLLLDTKMVAEINGNGQGAYQRLPVQVLPTSWANYSATYDPTDGRDMLHPTTAGVYQQNLEVADYPLMMWPAIRSQYFAEIPEATPGRCASALAKVESYEAVVRAQVAAASTPYDKQNFADHRYCYPGVSRILPPSSGNLGPA